MLCGPVQRFWKKVHKHICTILDTNISLCPQLFILGGWTDNAIRAFFLLKKRKEKKSWFCTDVLCCILESLRINKKIVNLKKKEEVWQLWKQTKSPLQDLTTDVNWEPITESFWKGGKKTLHFAWAAKNSNIDNSNVCVTCASSRAQRSLVCCCVDPSEDGHSLRDPSGMEVVVVGNGSDPSDPTEAGVMLWRGVDTISITYSALRQAGVPVLC